MREMGLTCSKKIDLVYYSIATNMDSHRLALAKRDVEQMMKEYSGRSTHVKRLLKWSMLQRRAEMNENDPVHAAVAAKEWEMARLRYHLFKKSLTS